MTSLDSQTSEVSLDINYLIWYWLKALPTAASGIEFVFNISVSEYECERGILVVRGKLRVRFQFYDARIDQILMSSFIQII